MISLDKLKRIINEIMDWDISINEMAYLGNLDEYKIVIESNDHNPPHFHIKLNNRTITKIEIPKDYLKGNYCLRYLKSQNRLSSNLESRLKNWFEQPIIRKTMTNLEYMQEVWNTLHPNNICIWSL